MTDKLSPLEIYSISEGSNIYNELSAYSSAIEDFAEDADALLREIIITTAQDYGLDMREALWSVPRTDLSEEERRTSILKRFGIGLSGFTLNGMYDFMASLGLEGEITEVPEKYRAYIKVTNAENISFPVRQYLTSQIEEFFPAHCQVFVDYRTDGTWNDLDAKRTMFDTYDLFGSNWEQLENFE